MQWFFIEYVYWLLHRVRKLYDLIDNVEKINGIVKINQRRIVIKALVSLEMLINIILIEGYDNQMVNKFFIEFLFSIST